MNVRVTKVHTVVVKAMFVDEHGEIKELPVVHPMHMPMAEFMAPARQKPTARDTTRHDATLNRPIGADE